MKITLVVNTKKPEAVEYANITEAYLREHGVKVKSIYEETYTRDDFSDNDCIITIGGDGTLLRLAGILRGQDTPILASMPATSGISQRLPQRRKFRRFSMIFWHIAIPGMCGRCCMVPSREMAR